MKTENLPFEGYVKLSGVNMSSALAMAVSPLHYRHTCDEPQPDRDTLRAGRAAHTGILEPDRYLLDYAVWSKTTSAGKSAPRTGAAWAEFCAMHEGKTILTAAQAKTSGRLAAAVRGNQAAYAALGLDPSRSALCESEVTLQWTHHPTGLECKARLDRITDDYIVDVKTTVDPTPFGFQRTAARLGYFARAAFYVDGLAECTGGVMPFAWVVVENKPPFDVVVYEASEDALQVGREQYTALLEKILDCTLRCKWPGIGDEATLTMDAPDWIRPEKKRRELTKGGKRLEV